MGFKIESLTAFIAIDKDGDEGLIGIPAPGSGAFCMPAVAADEERVKAIYPIVKDFMDRMGKEFRVIRLETRTDVTKDYEKE